MLSNLYIENMAVIEKSFIEFDNGLNVFTGETGAGKSIVIDAINAVIGQKISKDVVRTGSNKAVVTATFINLSENIKSVLSENGFDCEDDEIVIQREIRSDGRTTARISSRPVSVSVLKSIGSELVNIHGQHDTQVLLHPDKHIDIIDAFAGLEYELGKFKNMYQQYLNLKSKYLSINNDEVQKAQRIDILSYQIDEIESADLKIGEDETLAEKQKIIKNSSEIINSLSKSYSKLSGENNSLGAVDLLSDISQNISYSSEYYPTLRDMADRLEEIAIEVNEFKSEIRDYIDDFDFDPDELNIIESRIDEIYKLKHKYGDSIEKILEFCSKAKQELMEIETSDELRNKYLQQLKILGTDIKSKAKELSIARKKAAEKFTAEIQEQLKFLDMPNVSFFVVFSDTGMTSKGYDKIELMISTNPGEPPKPVAKIASGGELSRIMLALKNTMADKDKIPTMIFDEIDTGVSGGAAQKIGLKLKEASCDRQVLCVTHSAQIAALADTHLHITKSVHDNKTYTKVKLLDFNGRKQELARIMGTGQITDLNLKNAEELLKNAGHKC